GTSAPVVVALNGRATLRITTAGYCNPNFFMLVPASSITLAATFSGKNVLLSFPSQNGVIYRVFYRDALAAGGWTLLTTAQGDGGSKTVPDSLVGRSRFYKV